MRELIVEAKIENLDKVQDFIESSITDCPPKIKRQLAISVDEIFNNIASYAYAQGEGRVTVRITVDDAVMIEFEDSGAEYDPLERDDPDISLGADERELGGLGIFMVKNLMDSMEYRREGNRNLLTIKKSLP